MRRWLSFRNWPIAWKMALVIALVFLLGLALMALSGDLLVRSSLQQSQERELLERALQQAAQVGAFRDEYLRRLYSIAERNGADFGRDDAELWQKVLLTEKGTMPYLYDLDLLDLHGRVVASTSRSLIGQDWSGEAWYTDAASRMAGVSRLRTYGDAPYPLLVMYVPVPTATGPAGQVLVGRVPASSLWDLVDPIAVRASGYAFLVDNNMVTIAHGLRDKTTGHPTHQYVFYSIYPLDDPRQSARIAQANRERLYGEQEIAKDPGGLGALAVFIEGAPEASLDDPSRSIVHYYWDVQKTWKTGVAVPVGKPQGLKPAHKIAANDWVLCITVSDADFMAPLNQLRTGLLIVTAGTMLVACAVAVLLSRAFTGPVRRLAGLATRVRDGHYDERMHLRQEDELGRLAQGINAMLDRLVESLNAQQHQLATLLHTADAVRGDAATVSSSAEELAAATEQLSASAEEVSATVQSMARDAYEQMGQVQSTAGEIQGLDHEIGQLGDLSQRMERSAEHMRRIAEETERAVATAREHSGRIEAFVRKIEKFSRQTNMLALNATIEAARAGDMGESFAVVADEVRRLAESSRQALAEVGTLNEAIRQSMDAINGAVAQSHDAIVQIVSMAGEMVQTATRQGGASRALVETINRLAVIAEKNSAAAEEMAASVETQTAAFGQVSASSQDLAGLSLHLQELAERLAPDDAAAEPAPGGGGPDKAS